MWSSHNLTSLTNQSSYEVPVGYRKKTECGGNESDGKANTRPESTDYDGLYVELGRE